MLMAKQWLNEDGTMEQTNVGEDVNDTKMMFQQ